ncbi:MAG: cobalamin-binding protein [Oxalobacter sp.]
MTVVRWIRRFTVLNGLFVILSLTACTSDHQQTGSPKQEAIQVVDGDGYTVTINRPAQRIMTLSPHTTELVFAIGAGGQVIATTRFSDYPAEARHLPTVGDVHQLDIEKIISHRPDLIVLWPSGSASRQVDELIRTGIPIYRTHPKKLADIPMDMQKLGVLTGHPEEGEKRAEAWRNQLDALRHQYQADRKMRVFYQIYDRPLYTIGGTQIIDEAISVCGGQNIFNDIHALAPILGVETVLARNPDVIVSTGGMSGEYGLGLWKHFPKLNATRTHSLYAMDSDLISRPGPRMVQGIQFLCEKIDDARKKLSKE